VSIPVLLLFIVKSNVFVSPALLGKLEGDVFDSKHAICQRANVSSVASKKTGGIKRIVFAFDRTTRSTSVTPALQNNWVDVQHVRWCRGAKSLARIEIASHAKVHRNF